MKHTRDTILHAIRYKLGRSSAQLDEKILQTLEARLQAHSVHTYASLELLPCFVAQVKQAAGTLDLVTNIAEVPVVVTQFLQESGLPNKIVIDTRLNTLSWPAGLIYPTVHEDTTSVCTAFVGVAETGSLVLLSDASSPTSLNFLPDTHIVVLHYRDLVGYLEEVWVRLRAQFSRLPRTVNFITGPSRTADIEQTIQLGAHGPRRLHVILVKP